MKISATHFNVARVLAPVTLPILFLATPLWKFRASDYAASNYRDDGNDGTEVSGEASSHGQIMNII
jgi:hypothetical protein